MWKRYKKTNYEVCNIGLVRSIKTKKLIAEHIHDGYPRVSIYIDGKVYNKRVHVLVATCFRRKKKKEFNIVNHLNAIKLDSYYKNTEWTDISGNTKHAVMMGLIDMDRVRSFKQKPNAI